MHNFFAFYSYVEECIVAILAGTKRQSIMDVVIDHFTNDIEICLDFLVTGASYWLACFGNLNVKVNESRLINKIRGSIL